MGKFENNLKDVILSRPRMFEYANLDENIRDEFQSIFENYSKANPVLRVRKFFRWKNVSPNKNNFWNLSWEDLLMIRKAMRNNDLFKLMNLVYGVNEKQFLNLEVLNVFSTMKWITEQLTIIHNAEEERLKSDLSDDDKEAGAEQLSEYDYYNNVRALSENLLEHEKLLKLPYSIVFREMAYQKLINDINKKKNEIIARKNKRAG
jgi:hypothetical protein